MSFPESSFPLTSGRKTGAKQCCRLPELSFSDRLSRGTRTLKNEIGWAFKTSSEYIFLIFKSKPNEFKKQNISLVSPYLYWVHVAYVLTCNATNKRQKGSSFSRLNHYLVFKHGQRRQRQLTSEGRSKTRLLQSFRLINSLRIVEPDSCKNCVGNVVTLNLSLNVVYKRT